MPSLVGSEMCIRDSFNTDQGSQFTGSAFTGVLANNDIAISMDGKGAWRDNVFVERLWKSVKYEEVYPVSYTHLRAHETRHDLVCRLLLEKKKKKNNQN